MRNTLVCLLIGLCGLSAADNRVETNPVLLTHDDGAVRVGIRYTTPPHGHIYWRNPGTSGIATEIDWDLPKGWSAGPLQWPAPTRFEDATINDTTFGYTGEVVLFAELTRTDESAPNLQTVDVHTYWLVCVEDGECIPEEATLTVDLADVASVNPPDVPRSLSGSGLPINVTIVRGDNAHVSIELKRGWQLTGGAPEFFPYAGEPWTVDDNGRGDPSHVIFVSAEPADEYARGVVRLQVRDVTGAKRELTFEIGIPPAE
jgi:hypothetical protein